MDKKDCSHHWHKIEDCGDYSTEEEKILNKEGQSLKDKGITEFCYICKVLR